MDPYSNGTNGYGGRGSVGNSNQKYQQSPGFGKHHFGPQYAQQQAQHYQKGPPNQKYKGQKEVYSTDQQAMNSNKNRNLNHHNQHNNNNNNNNNNNAYRQPKQRQYYNNVPNPPNQYAQFQQFQQQQYAQQQQQKQPKQPPQPRRVIKQRKQNSPIPHDMDGAVFFGNANAPQQQRKLSQNQSQEHPNRNQRRIRSKSPNGNHRDHRREKRSVPNVASNNNGYGDAPIDNRKSHHSSTPNAQHLHTHSQSRDRDRRSRRKKSPRPQAVYNEDQYTQQQHRSKSPNAQRRKNKTGQRAANNEHLGMDMQPHPHSGPNHEQYTGYVSPSPSPQPPPPSSSQPAHDKKRRHTTTPYQAGHHGHAHRRRSKSPNPHSRGKRRSKSPNPHRKSAADLNQNHAKLNKGKLAEKFTIREKLGRGNFSVVRRVIRKEDEREFAAKIISTKTMSQQEIKDTHDEVDILAKLHHPNIVTLVDYIFTPRHLYIVLELLSGGELFERLQKQKKFNEQMAANITKQLADALAYMHSKGVVHRDLKPENILYEHMGDDAKIKISDFGLSRDMSDYKNVNGNNNGKNNKRPLKTSCGTPGYVAPEIIRQQTYDESVDLWAAGVIIYILLCGFPPFQGAGSEPQQSMFRKIKSGKYSYPKPAWSKISACAMDCIDSLLCVNPKDRMTANELLAHPWIKQAEMRRDENDGSFLDIHNHFQSNLSNYLHKKRFRRGVRLIITLNRMVRGAGLETIAREQRNQFRVRLKKYKKQLKEQQRKIYEKQQELKSRKLNNNDLDDDDDEYMGYTIIDPDSTPAIDYSKV